MKIHVWCPGLRGPGGIEAYSKEIVGALAQLFRDDAHITVFARNDRSSALRDHLPGNVVRIGMGQISNRLRALAFAATVFSRGVIDRPDLVLSTHLNFAPVARLLKRLQRTRYWISLHGIEVWHLKNKSRVRALLEADLLLPVSRYTRDRVVQEQKIPGSKFKILPDTFDAERFTLGPKSPALLKRYNLAENKPVILTVGRLTASERYKGHDRILRALPEVRGQISNVRYLIVGDGDDRVRLEELTRELNLSESVVFCGRVCADELADHYRLCDVFAMPSTGEGFGIVFLEALACGKPVVAGNHDASSDALKDGEFGLLIDPDDVGAISAALIDVLTKRTPEHLRNADVLRQKVIETYGYPKFVERVRDLTSHL